MWSLFLSIIFHALLIAIPNQSGPEIALSNHPHSIQVSLVDTSTVKYKKTPLPIFEDDTILSETHEVEDATQIEDVLEKEMDEVSEQSIGIIEELSPQVSTNHPPNYPYLARKRGFEGTVILKVNVLTNGSPGSIKVLTSSGYDILDHSAIQAVQKWSFIPAKKGSDIIDQWVEIPIQFKLNSKT